MKPAEFMDFLHILENLKCGTRHGWTHTLRRESVAEHSFRLACMALLLSGEFPELDMDKVIKMCLIHDWGEAVTGDIPSFEKSEADEAEESTALAGLVAQLPQPQRGEMTALFAEMDALKTPEARVYKALDKLEAVIQHNEAPLNTWIPLERELNRTYAVPECAPFPYLAALRQAALEDTDRKLSGSTEL